LDYAVGSNATFVSLYLIPMGLAAWFFGLPFSYFFALRDHLALGKGIHRVGKSQDRRGPQQCGKPCAALIEARLHRRHGNSPISPN